MDGREVVAATIKADIQPYRLVWQPHTNCSKKEEELCTAFPEKACDAIL